MFMTMLERICRYLHIDMEQGYKVFCQLSGTELKDMCRDLINTFHDRRVGRKGKPTISWYLCHKVLNKLDQNEYEAITQEVREYFDETYDFHINYKAVELIKINEFG